MDKRLDYLAIDGALSNYGLAEGYIKNGIIYVTSISNIKYERRTKAVKTLDDQKHIRKLYRLLRSKSANKDVIFAELLSGSKGSSKSLWSLAIASAINACLVDKPLVEPTPLQVKRAAGSSKANKKFIINWAYSKYPNLNWYKFKNGKLKNSNEHMADAIAVAHAGYSKYLKSGYDLV